MACPKVDLIVGPAILIYLATSITEIVSSVPIGLIQDNFKGHCVFSAKVAYQSINKTMAVTSFGSNSTCEFCTYLTIVTVLFSLLYGSYSAYALYHSVENASQMWVLPAMMVNALLLVLKFISSCVLSVGMSQFCSSITKDSAIKSCKDGQDLKGGWYYMNDDTLVDLNGGSYYSYSTTAQSASWFCVFEWALLCVLAFLHYRRNIALRSSGTAMGAPPSGIGSSGSDTAGIVANEVLPGNSVINPNYKE